MKISLFAQAPYRYLPDDFEQNHESVCSVPYSLTTRQGVYSSIRDFMDELMFGARSGEWRHLWRVAGRYANVSVFDVDSIDRLHELLSELPLFPYLDIRVTPLATHPSAILAP
jgi:muconolactone delta-isomerase